MFGGKSAKQMFETCIYVYIYIFEIYLTKEHVTFNTYFSFIGFVFVEISDLSAKQMTKLSPIFHTDAGYNFFANGDGKSLNVFNLCDFCWGCL